jgi:hypothetical protein
MNRVETIKLLAVINGAYPRFEIKAESANITIDLWQSIFKDIPAENIVQAVHELIKELKFPPTIADITQKVDQMLNPNRIGTHKELIDLWNEIIEALPRAKHYINESRWDNVGDDTNIEIVKEIFEKLSPENKRYFGSCENFIKTAEETDIDEFRRYEKTNYIKMVSPIVGK